MSIINQQQPDALQIALHHHRNGQLAQAEAIYRQILAVLPHHPDANYLLGRLALQCGQPGEAVRLAQRTIAAMTAGSMLYALLGEAQVQLGQHEAAIAAYRTALQLQPDLLDAWLELSQLLAALGRHDELIDAYQHILVLRPDMAAVHNNLGSLYKDAGNVRAALPCCRAAAANEPSQPVFQFNLANVCWELGELAEAETAYRRTLELGMADAVVWSSLGGVLQALKKPDEALDCWRKAIALDPADADARMQLAHLLQQRCQWDELATHIAPLRQSLTQPVTPRNLFSPFSFLVLPETTAAEHRLCAERWAHNRYAGIAPLSAAPARVAGSKIRLGYLSADFHDHATAQLMAEVFELHDRERFEVHAFSCGPDTSDAMRQRLQRAFDTFTDVRDDAFVDAARKIRERGIDILIDLKGYTENGRPAILAHRPAPIQVNYLAYPGTMGAPFIDYLLADEYIVPPDADALYSEQVIRLPACYQPNDRQRALPQARQRSDCGLPDDGVVFCSFNHTYKITPGIFDIWCGLLREVPGSVLWLLASNDAAVANLQREAEKLGVDAGRLIFAPALPHAEHLARLQCADLFLDSLPVNAHTSCSDALWVGVPVVSCSGAAFASRVAGSLLRAMGVPELATTTLAGYQALALDLARDPARRLALRGQLAAARTSAPLFDSVRFTRQLEDAYAKMLALHADASLI
ncbi:Predicted O-linked N-acetylglucosamine transferase, SPINDLY family [Andreprevotia lacus DSM 23236]|jgi:predicted O-linked N-acetylglucosamine transferase (SPINDLY family)|uniref:protein O-GlcNAc transferase n=1 Tax=Andreprevotia lacus DSM 23236 TaxID=1121001 RepID=A0A1W1XWN6_9NEIS|nr:tetratricopeptide repeat protein [Andreprevotia lacus]SMC28254.1 Predicted O-linked N-acetylglucosamine transferase, SPINDLY family [Andreprevotia lacus DSM 23236]